MAMRSQQMHDGGIIERRLRPIYDWLDIGNNKKALQEADKVLKKSPSLQSARALKALALLRLGKAAEAHSVLDALFAEKPTDDTALTFMTICYRETSQLDKVCQLYEAAVKAEPTSEELHSHLFMSYVRIGDYKSQQRAAMALYKFAPKNPYYFWAVMSIVLQAKSMEEKSKRNILLSLAQKMVENFIKENKIKAEQEVRLYIMILELQEKWEEILEFLESPLYTRLVPGSMPQASIEYLKKLGQWKKLNVLCKELLMDNVDRWNYYMVYFDSVFELMKCPESAGESVNADDTPEKCHEFLCLLVESMGTARTLRGPYLARLELWRRLVESGGSTAILGSGVALCVQYLRVFADKPCAMPDLKPYLAQLRLTEREAHCRDFLTCHGMDENACPDSSVDVQRHMSCLAAWRACSPPPSAACARHLAALLRKHYARALAKGLPSTVTEFSPHDMYGVRAAQHYFYAAMELQSSEPLIEALCLLELVLAKSPANFHAKLLLIKFYHLLGNAHAADALFARLEAKHVQLASLEWLHAARLAAAAQPALAASRARDLLAFLTHHHKDSVEHLTFAYKYGTFEKLGELSAFRRRLAPLQADKAAVPRAHVTHAGEYTDNRDLSVIVSQEPPQLQDAALKERTQAQEVLYVTIRQSIVECVDLCTELSSKPSSERSELVSRLRQTLQQFDDDMGKCPRYEPERITIAGPLPHRIIAFVNSPVPYRELYKQTISIVEALASGDSIRGAGAAAAAKTALAGSKAPAGAKDVWGMREALEEISNYLEFMAIATYMLTVCHEITTPSAKKNKKKTSLSPEETEVTNSLNELTLVLIKNYEVLETVFAEWPQYEVKSTLEATLESLDIHEKYQCPVEGRLKTGRDEMCSENIGNIKKKIKLLKSLIA